MGLCTEHAGPCAITSRRQSRQVEGGRLAEHGVTPLGEGRRHRRSTERAKTYNVDIKEKITKSTKFASILACNMYAWRQIMTII
jgi:hypothetical protein